MTLLSFVYSNSLGIVPVTLRVAGTGGERTAPVEALSRQGGHVNPART